MTDALVTEYEWQGPKRGADRAVLLAHGAGSNMNGAALLAVADALAVAKIPSLRFNYPYRTAGKNAPDRPKVLDAATREAAAELGPLRGVPLSFADAADLGRLVPRDAPHQGVVAEVERLPDRLLADSLHDAPEGRPLIVLDQVTDPHNVGAVLRSAAAFDALALVTQDRHAPPESGALAKAASGALEIVPWVRVVNLARALEEMAEAGYWRLALAGEADALFAEALPQGPVALVLGAEGEGMRGNIAAHCDALARLPISDRIESLNVSNACAIALYAAAAHKG
jgi:23S rRNA (guanosine2251-2'-O)-methyltransferase